MFRLSRFISDVILTSKSNRFDERKSNDKDRFIGVLKVVSGKRLTYDELRGYQTSH
jgi:hypothetical protein